MLFVCVVSVYVCACLEIMVWRATRVQANVNTYVFRVPGATHVVKPSSARLRENNSRFVLELNHQKNTVVIIFKKQYIILFYSKVLCSHCLYMSSWASSVVLGQIVCFLESSASRVLLIRLSFWLLRGVEIHWSGLVACFHCDTETQASAPWSLAVVAVDRMTWDGRFRWGFFQRRQV